MINNKFLNLVAFFIFITCHSYGQQIPDIEYAYKIKSPAYKCNKGPMVLIDAAHNNIHTANGRYKPLKKLLESDGYVVETFFDTLTKEKLVNCKIFITSNALHSSNVSRWTLPTPSAFTDEEIHALHTWVNDGGSLFIITDHMPCAGAISKLGGAFGFEFINGFAIGNEQTDYIKFKTSTGSLKINSLSNGNTKGEKIDSVSTFTGTAFKIPNGAESILTFKGNYFALLPDTAWKFSANTIRIPIDGWSQGAILKYRKGRVAMFGEAGMFTAQLGGPDKIKSGFNSKHAPQNTQFALNVIHWLDGKIK
jgi:hypothetical protein